MCAIFNHIDLNPHIYHLKDMKIKLFEYSGKDDFINSFKKKLEKIENDYKKINEAQDKLDFN